MRWSLVLIGIVCWAADSSAFAGDLDEPLGLRIPLALDRITAFTDVIGRQASVAHRLGSSVNPASDDFLREPPFDFPLLITGTTNQTLFEDGAHVSGVSATSLLRLPQNGTFSFTVVRTDTPEGETEGTGSVILRSNEFRPGFAFKLSPDFAIGTEISVIDSELDVDDRVSGFERDVETDAWGVTWNLGALWAVDDKLTLGAVGGIGATRTESEGSVTLPPPPLGPGPLPIDVTETLESRTGRVGVGYRFNEQLGVYADANYIHLQSLNLGAADMGRFSLGAEATLTPWLVWRGGVGIDTIGEWTFSTNVGLYVFDPLLLEAGYQYNAFPEVEREFGTGQLLSFSAVLLF